MKIHFCDLCNESVPQADLDKGSAFLRKGRVVCATCDALMTHEQDAAGHSEGQAAEAGGTATATKPATKSAPAASSPSGSPAPAVPHHHPVHMRPQKSMAGVGMGMVAILISALLGFFIYDQMEQQRLEFGQIETSVNEQIREQARKSDLAATDLRDEVRRVGTRLETQSGDSQKALQASIQESEQQMNDALQRVEELAAEVRVIKESAGLVQRHDQEMITLQQKYSQLNDELSALGGALADLERRSDAAAAAGISMGGNDAAAAAAPPWMGLVANLRSDDPGARWTAVTALGETKDPAVVEHLVPLLRDTDIFVRMATARVLGELNSNESIGPLINALEDSEPPVREAAYVALTTLTRRNLPFNPIADDPERAKRVKAWRDWWEKARDELEG